MEDQWRRHRRFGLSRKLNSNSNDGLLFRFLFRSYGSDSKFPVL